MLVVKLEVVGILHKEAGHFISVDFFLKKSWMRWMTWFILRNFLMSWRIWFLLFNKKKSSSFFFKIASSLHCSVLIPENLRTTVQLFAEILKQLEIFKRIFQRFVFFPQKVMKSSARWTTSSVHINESFISWFCYFTKVAPKRSVHEQWRCWPSYLTDPYEVLKCFEWRMRCSYLVYIYGWQTYFSAIGMFNFVVLKKNVLHRRFLTNLLVFYL